MCALCQVHCCCGPSIGQVEYLVTADRFLLGLVFLASAVGKARNGGAFTAFAGSVRELRVLPPAWTRGAGAGVVAGVVVAVEALVPVLLVARTTTPVGLALATVLLAGLAVTVALVVRRGARVACLCFGVTAAPLGRRHVVRNVALAVAAAAGASGAFAPAESAHPVGSTVAATVGLVVAGLVVAMDDIVELFRPLPVPHAE